MSYLLSSGLFSRYNNDHQNPSHIIKMSSIGGGGAGADGVNLDKFFQDVEAIKGELKDLKTLYNQLQSSRYESNSRRNTKMDARVSSSLKKAKLIKLLLESLDRSNAANRTLPGCGPGSSSERTRTSVVNFLRKKFRDYLTFFNDLRQRMAVQYLETVQRRYFIVTGEEADESTLDSLISTGHSETLLQKAIQKNGRGQVMDTIMEIQERHDAVKGIERNLMELHQVFLEMAVLVDSQGEQLDNIQNQVERASPFVRVTPQLVEAKKTQRNTRKWYCFWGSG